MTRLSVRDLSVLTRGGATLVDAISFDVGPGEWFALIGESGSGKSVTAFAIGDLLPAALLREAGSLRLDGRELLGLGAREMRALRGPDIAYIFQDYSRAFTPYLRLGDQMAEALLSHEKLTREATHARLAESLDEVGLPPEDTMRRYPFQLSGGQLQRAAIASAMSMRPRLLIADEPTTALDAVTQADVLDLIDRARERHDCSVLFITHDLRSAARHADRLAVMQHGHIIEAGPTPDVVAAPREGYTRALFAAVPRLRSGARRLPTRTDQEVP